MPFGDWNMIQDNKITLYERVNIITTGIYCVKLCLFPIGLHVLQEIDWPTFL